MRIGILGSGLIGAKLGTILAQAGHEVVFSYARSEGKLRKLAQDAKGNARAGTPHEAAQNAEAVLLAVHWSRIDDVLKRAGDLSGKTILTCSLPMDAGNTKLILGTTTSGAEELARKVPEARIVSASIPFPVKCCSACIKPDRKRRGQVWCIAATTTAPRRQLRN
jgi:predicted dinucleotide-binding enzyme